MKKAMVAGSFDPFTTGHLAIVKQAADLFDEVHVMIFKNAGKKRVYSASLMIEAIDKTLTSLGITNCVVREGDGLLAKYCMNNGIQYNIRGLRNSADYYYEESMIAGNNFVYPELKTIYFRADGNVISSTVVRELASYGEDIRSFVPAIVYEAMQAN